MIDGMQAVQHAFANLIQLVGARELANVEGIQLEEFELSDDSKHWNVTLSYPVKKPQEEGSPQQLPESIAKFIQDTPRRKWRTFKIDSQDGRLVAMKVPASV
jgi:hypothetical protein